jgi:hypothetical protein
VVVLATTFPVSASTVVPAAGTVKVTVAFSSPTSAEATAVPLLP